MQPISKQQRPNADAFPGFEPLDANYIYCPNQFFDVCLPNCSRCAVRIVAYLLRETLGWLDKEGNPKQQDIAVSYRDLIEKAGVSRGAIGAALQEATDHGFIACRRKGAASSSGHSARTATYTLNWDERGEYTRSINTFAGFFVGQGYRTPVPNRFFDEVIRYQPLAVAKVVGTVIRHTVGYQNQFGGRRSTAPLSQRYIAQYSGLSVGRVVSESIRTAEQVGYIICVDEGHFSHDSGQQQAATFMLRWSTGSKSPVGNRSKNTSRTSSKLPADDQFKKPSTRKTDLKDNCKQQSPAISEVIQKLIDNGLDRRTATGLIEKRGVEVAENQLTWLDARKPTENRTGMLRKSIDENWAKPAAIVHKERQIKLRERDQQKIVARNADESATKQAKRRRNERKRRLLAEWEAATIDERKQWIQRAVQQESSKMLSEILRRQSATKINPPRQVLEVIAVERCLPKVNPSSGSVSEAATLSCCASTPATRQGESTPTNRNQARPQDGS